MFELLIKLWKGDNQNMHQFTKICITRHWQFSLCYKKPRWQPEYASVYQNMHYKALTLPKYALKGTDNSHSAIKNLGDNQNMHHFIKICITRHWRYQNMHYKALTLLKYVLQGTVACSKWTAYCSNWVRARWACWLYGTFL